MKRFRLVALLLALVLVAGTFAACNPNTGTTEPGGNTTGGTGGTTTTGTGGATQPTQTSGGKTYRTYLTSECPILNGHDDTSTTLQTPHDYCSSPLFRRVANEAGTGFVFIGDLAAELPIKIDDYNWQIKIRPEAKWQNGDPINADTFMYSFKMQIDPILVNQMADFFSANAITIVNAKEYSLQGDTGTVLWEDVGLKKIDEYTIQLTTVSANTQNDVCSQFTDRSTFPVYEPYYEAGMNESRTQTTYGTTLDNWMGCGPYKFVTWEYDSIHVYEKNPDHWLSDLFNYDTVEVRIIPEMNARVELWEQGLLDSLVPDSNTIETYIDDPRMREYESLTVFHIDINCKNPDNPVSGILEYRKAMYHAMNREVIAVDLFGYMEPTGTYVNSMAGILSDSGLTYRKSAQGQAVTDMVNSWGPAGYNPEMARDYLAQAYAIAGIPDDTVINVKFLAGDSKTWKAVAEYLLEEWNVIFEGKVNLEIITYAGMSASDYKNTGDDKWDLSPNDWTRGVSRNYPYTCFYYYTSEYSASPNNYFVAEFDAQYAICDAPEMKLTSYDKMLDETRKLEEMYLEYVIHIPVVQNVNYEMISDRIALPVQTNIPGFGWGFIYGDIVQ